MPTFWDDVQFWASVFLLVACIVVFALGMLMLVVKVVKWCDKEFF